MMIVDWGKGKDKTLITHSSKGPTTLYRAVLHNTDDRRERVESMWLTSKEKAKQVGEEGLKLYGGSHFSIEETN